MPTRFRRRSRFRFLLIPLVLSLIALYFGWQSTRGVFSHAAREALHTERVEREGVLAGLVAEREALEARVKRLRTDALDADLLDERARAKLHMAFPDEIVIVHDSRGAPVQALASHGE
ncbi:MAG: septum formation initiator family protein [Pseudomonadota bacterium]